MSDEVTVIAGRYELSSLVGEGGMASVWRAKDLTLARPVAVKLLYARDDRDREALVDRFLREARIAASVQHRNVVHIVDFGKTEDETPYMVMELLQGENLGERLSGNPPLTTTEFIRIASMTLRGLSAVHQAEIVHRDLKPENIFLVEENGQPFPKILDFGISRSVQPASGRRSALTTKEGVIVGTPEYMSPEQARGVRTIDSRTDIYSMGAILYEGLTGHPPFEAENVGDLIIDIVTGSFPPVSDLNPNVPESLSRVVDKALSRRPEDRYQTADEMQQALLQAAEDLGKVRRSLSDFPRESPGADPDTAMRPLASMPTDELEFQITLDSAQPVAAEPQPGLPPRESGPEDTAPTMPELEPFAVIEQRKRRRLWLLGAALVIGTGFGVMWGDWEPEPEVNVVPMAPDEASIAAAQLQATRSAEAVEPSAEAETTEAETTEPAPEAAPVIETIELRLTNLPAGAEVMLDGESAGEPPLQLDKDGAPHEVVVRHGRAEWKHSFTADADVEAAVRFPKPTVRKRPPARATPRKKAPPPPKRLPSALRKLDF